MTSSNQLNPTSWKWIVPLALLLPGCGQQATPSGGVAVQAVENGPAEPGEIELSDPKVTFEAPNIVRFEVKYRFVKGKPDKYYCCDIKFPGTANQGKKSMNSWELKSEGVIRDGVVVSKPPVQSFEIEMSETTSPQEGYKKISNVVSGPVN